MVVAVDFDGTLCEHRFPEIGEIKPQHRNVIDYVRKLKSEGAMIILWTCREDIFERNYLTEAVEWCTHNNIPIDFVNEYPNPDFGGFAARKVCADLYIDDKALNVNHIF